MLKYNVPAGSRYNLASVNVMCGEGWRASIEECLIEIDRETYVFVQLRSTAAKGKGVE